MNQETNRVAFPAQCRVKVTLSVRSGGNYPDGLYVDPFQATYVNSMKFGGTDFLLFDIAGKRRLVRSDSVVTMEELSKAERG